MEGLPLFCYFTVEFNHIYSVCVWGGGVRFPLYLSDLQPFELAMQDSHLKFSSTFSSKSCTKTWDHLYISYSFWKSRKNVDCFI